MIEEISISDLGVIGDARLEFSRGLTVLTGETGAGKTMVLSALGLLLGNRADASAIRTGASQSFVEGRWYLDGSRPGVAENLAEIKNKLDEAGVPVEAGELILNRSVSSEGRSKAAANGRAVPVGVISEIGERLVVVHGQSDQLRLKSAVAQREALDQYAGAELSEVAGAYRQLFDAWKLAQARFEQLSNASANRTAELEELRAAVADLEKINPKPGEFRELSEQAERLGNLESLRAAAETAHEALSAADLGDSLDAVALLGLARKALEPVSATDPKLGELAERLRDLGYQVGDVSRELSHYVTGLDAESEYSLEWIQERRASLTALTRRFGVDYEELSELTDRFSHRLLELDNSAESLETLMGEIEALEKQARELASQLTAIRNRAGERLAQEVTAELAGLAMVNSSVIVQVSTTDQLRPHGCDEVAILLANRGGGEARPVARGASGGELSRIMLAIEVVLAKTEQAPTFIFDEVDAGIGGSTAIEIGRRLSRLAKTSQVIVVTHLAQVAAFADKHLKVSKTHSGEVTSSDVATLHEDTRVVELARMLSGLSESESARQSAQELLMLARQSE